MKLKLIKKLARMRQEKLLIEALQRKEKFDGYILNDEELHITQTYLTNLEINDREKADWVVEESIRQWGILCDMMEEADYEEKSTIKPEDQARRRKGSYDTIEAGASSDVKRAKS